MNPLITIAIPAYQRPDLLERALKSALAQMQLSLSEPIEVLVVEDPPAGGHTEASDRIERLCGAITDARFRYHRNPRNLGLDNWNRCLQEARGRWIVILHDDDWLEPGFLRRCLDLIAANPELKLVGCRAILEREGEPAKIAWGALARHRPQRVGPFDFLLGNPFFVSGVMMDRRLALELGGFSHDWAPTQDSDCWLRFCEAAPAGHLPTPLVHYFIGQNASLDPEVLTACIVNDFKQRRRILETHYPGNVWLRWHSRLKPYREQAFLAQLFRRPLDTGAVDRALMEAGWRPVARGLRWTYLPLRVVLGIIGRFCGPRLATQPGG